ncbi:MAG TPA: toll/interleukin-1 receptor domain-containing protein [Herpetosiphonaceae bacterium]
MCTPPASPAFDYDVFISYSSKDESWVQTELLPRLESWSLHCISPHSFEVGAPRVDEIERAVLASRKTLLILSPEYLADAWAIFGDQVVQTLDPASRARRLIPLIKTACKLPERLGKRVPIDFTS